jgi:hypothetical protein
MMNKNTSVGTALLDARLGLVTAQYRRPYRIEDPILRERRRIRRELVETGRLEQVLNRDLQREGYTTVRAHARRTCDPVTGVVSLVITHSHQEPV